MLVSIFNFYFIKVTAHQAVHFQDLHKRFGTSCDRSHLMAGILGMQLHRKSTALGVNGIIISSNILRAQNPG